MPLIITQRNIFVRMYFHSQLNPIKCGWFDGPADTNIYNISAKKYVLTIATDMFFVEGRRVQRRWQTNYFRFFTVKRFSVFNQIAEFEYWIWRMLFIPFNWFMETKKETKKRKPEHNSYLASLNYIFVHLMQKQNDEPKW